MKISGAQCYYLTSLYYGKHPRKSNWRMRTKLQNLGLMTFNIEKARYEITEAGKEYVTSRPWFEDNKWLWTNEKKPVKQEA